MRLSSCSYTTHLAGRMYAFVNFRNSDEAKRAVATLNNREVCASMCVSMILALSEFRASTKEVVNLCAYRPHFRSLSLKQFNVIFMEQGSEHLTHKYAQMLSPMNMHTHIHTHMHTTLFAGLSHHRPAQASHQVSSLEKSPWQIC